MKSVLGLVAAVCLVSASMAPTMANAAGKYGSNRANAAPLAYQLYCLKNPRECKGGGRKTIHVAAGTMSKLSSVNRAVNRSIRARNDSKADVWSSNVSVGDCEDYALTKRRRLLEMGFPAAALRMAIARTSTGEGHAVLVVRTDKGDRVLDNRTDSIMGWNQSGLRLVKMAGPDPLRWS